MLHQVADAFGDWGIPTADNLLSLHAAFPDLPLIASGGIQHGVHAAKAVAMGAELAGAARPFLLAADHSEQAVAAAVDVFIQQFKTAMFACGCGTVAALRSTPILESIP